MNGENKEILLIGETTFRNERKRFGIKLADRTRHCYIIGKTGTGKTSLLVNCAIQDILAGRGVGFIDPHGEAAETLLDFVPRWRINDVIYFNPSDLDRPIAFNVMEKVSFEYRHIVCSAILGAFKKIWPDVWSARMEYILSNAVLALLEIENSTLLGINRILSDEEFRAKVVKKLKDPIVKAFWEREFKRYTRQYEVEATASIQNKVGQFISNPLIRNIVGQVKNKIDMRKVMDEQKILIVNLSKGKIGEENSKLLGSLVVTKLYLAAVSRIDLPEEKRIPFFLYIDEFQNFATEVFVHILSEARKYGLALTIAHQYLSQLEELTPLGITARVRDAIFGNVGTIVVFRVGAKDAEFLEKEFSPECTANDFVNLPKYQIYVRLLIDGIASRPFAAQTLPPFEKPPVSYKDKIIRISAERYGTKREKVEKKIAKWLGFEEELPLEELLKRKPIPFTQKKVKKTLETILKNKKNEGN
jgi:type IV secretory pathway TraG/TraD family ATPase VirD4